MGGAVQQVLEQVVEIVDPAEQPSKKLIERLLDAPVKEKISTFGQSDLCIWGSTSMQGWRINNEDTHIAQIVELPDKKKGMLFGVFDGHGDDKVAKDAKEKLPQILLKNSNFKKGDYKKALEEAFMAYDLSLAKEEYAKKAGCCACVVLVTPDKIYCANSGDSRAVLSSADTAKPMSKDHKPTSKEEKKRIENADHVVMAGRINGDLSVSRGFGDFKFKKVSYLKVHEQALIASPDVTCSDRTKDDQFIILACDGIWDCISSEEIIKKFPKSQTLEAKKNRMQTS